MSVLIAKATTITNGVEAAIQTCFTNIHIEGDNKTLIQLVQSPIQAVWEIQILIHNIHTCIQLCNNVFITCIFRQWNCAADWIAKHGVSLNFTTIWNEVPHRDLLCIFYENNLGKILERRAT